MSPEEINQFCLKSANAFYHSNDCFNSDVRRNLMHSIAQKIETYRQRLVSIAYEETNLSEGRLNNELDRTIYQWNNYSEEGINLLLEREIINEELHEGGGKGQKLQKKYIPIGPVVIFGAANFPFAYSTLGGDVASAFAAGCSVIVKAHPGHPKTSALSAAIINECLNENKLNSDFFIHLDDSSNECGQTLVQNENITGVGFTGSLSGGKALQKMIHQRKTPIPFYAEMSSVNPVFILPSALLKNTESLIEKLAASISVDAGQFCTQPGILILIDNENSRDFLNALSIKLNEINLIRMLNTGISNNYIRCRNNITGSKGVHVLTKLDSNELAKPTLAVCNSEIFISNPALQEEVFGSFTLAVMCKDENEILKVANHFQGQLTASIHSVEKDEPIFKELFNVIQYKAGRLILNYIPTGVRVASAMHHGGPFPSSSDLRFSSVGAEAVLRFVRPICLQNFPSI